MSKGTKQSYNDVLPTAQRIVEKLGAYSQRIEIAGSLRRQRPLIGDIEIVAIPDYARDLFGDPDLSRNMLKHFLITSGAKMPKCGDKYIQFKYGAYMVDLFTPSPETWGSVFLIRTGSHDFNMWLMTVWSPKVNVRFTGGRLVRRHNGELIETPEEVDVFKALQLPLIPPEARDDGRWMKYIE